MLNLKTFALTILRFWPIIGQPIYYSSYVELCDYEGARNASKIGTKTIFKDNEVHGGYFTVNKKLNINLYSLFVKSNTNWKEAPLIVWFQGQPGCTALYAVFGQNGPYRVNNELVLIKNEYAWTNEYNVLYLDSMIFMGYSYAQNASHVIPFLEDLGTYLYDALFQFYQIYSNIAGNDLYLSGEMYSGKYLLLLGHVIHRRNPISHLKMHLKGLIIGSGFSDPENMLQYSAFMYQIGLIDYTKMKEIQNMEESIKRSIRSYKFEIAQQQLLSVWIEMQLIGFDFPMDFTRANKSFDPIVFQFLQSTNFRNALNLQQQTFYQRNDVLPMIIGNRSLRAILEANILQTAKYLLPNLLDHYRVLYYCGQFDMLVPYVHVTNFIKQLEWKGAEIYFNSEKIPRNNWYVDNELAGYWKSVYNLTDVLVRNASQMIDVSQPKWAFNLIKTFLKNGFPYKKLFQQIETK